MSSSPAYTAPGAYIMPPRRPAPLPALTGVELYKLWKRPLTWFLCGFLLLLSFLAFVVLIYTGTAHPEAFEPGHLLHGSPGILDTITQQLTMGRRVGEFVMIAAGGAAFGGEYASGAIRIALSRGPSRLSYMVAKYLALVIIALLFIALDLVLSFLMTALLPIFNPQAPSLLATTPAVIGGTLKAAGGMLENMLVCLVLGSALAIVGRSTAVGVAGGLVYLVGEDIGARILPILTTITHLPLWKGLVSYLLTPNLDAFFAHSLPLAMAERLDTLDGVLPTPLPSAGHDFAVALGFVVVLLAISSWFYLKRDILQ
jgi:ABC-type transport system involved in multi-copper enzyme maturation permease subunit